MFIEFGASRFASERLQDTTATGVDTACYSTCAQNFRVQAQLCVACIPGTSNVARLEENVAAAGMRLTREELDGIERLSPRGVAAGQRYNPETLALVDQ